MNRAIDFLEDIEEKPYKDRNKHSSHRLLLYNNKYKQAFPWYCWKCHSVLVNRRMKDGDNGLYCRKCCRWRKFRVPVEMGGCVSYDHKEV